MRLAACTSFLIATSSEGMPIAELGVQLGAAHRQTIPGRTAPPEKLLFQKWNFTPDLPQTMRCCADAGGSSAS